MRLADVALPIPVARHFTYSVPPPVSDRVRPGARVVCPLGGRRVLGVVLDVRVGDPEEGPKANVGAVDEEPLLPLELLAFVRELAS